jgi:uncharacterized membrane protein
MATIIYPLLFAVVGAVVYLVAGNPPNASPTTTKLSEMGRIAYFVGLIWLVYLMLSRTFHF